MINPETVTFPITLERFIEFQEAETGRKANAMETEFFSDVVDLANEAYAAAAVGNLQTGAEILAAIDAAAEDTKECANLAALCRGWLALACRKGTELLAKTGLLPS